MFLVVFRFLMLILIIGFGCYFLQKYWRKLTLTEGRREEFDDAKTSLEETFDQVSRIPNIDDKKLKKGKEKLNKFLKKGKEQN